MFQEIQEKKHKIIEIISELEKIARAFDIHENYDLFEKLKKDFSEELTFNVLCLGDFSSGKSTFVNKFFVGEEILTTRHTTTTAKLCVVKYGEAKKLNIVDSDGNKASYTSDLEEALANYGAVDGQNIGKVNYLELEIPSEILKEGVVVIDSPGLNDPEIERMNVTLDYIDRADCVLYFLNAQQAWKKNEKDFLEEKILQKKDLDKIFFILNYWDLIEGKAEKEGLLKYVKKQMLLSLDIAKANVMDSTISDLPLIPVSSKTEENFSVLRDSLGKYFIEKKGNNLVSIKIKKVRSLVSGLMERLNDNITINQKAEEEINAILKTIEQEYIHYKDEFDRFKEQVSEKFDKLWGSFSGRLDNLLRDVSEDVSRQFNNRLRSIKNDADLQVFLLKSIKTSLYLRRVDLQSIESDLSIKLQLALKEYKAKFNLQDSLLEKSWNVDAFDPCTSLEMNYSGNEFIAWAVGSAATSAAIMLTALGTFAPILGVPVLLAGLFYGNPQDKNNLHKAQSELLENIDNEIYKHLKLAYQPSYNQARKKELFEVVFSHIDAEIIDAFKEKEAIFLQAKTNKVNNVENEKIEQINSGLDKLNKLDENLVAVDGSGC